jgi:transcriptional regulator with XRE-family HTH domain
MDAERKARLEARGCWVGSVEDFLGLTPHEREMVDLRLKLSREIREARERRGMSQAAFARAMKTSQARVSRIEAGYSDVSIELMLRALDVAGRGVSFRFADRPMPTTAGGGKAESPPRKKPTPAAPLPVQKAKSVPRKAAKAAGPPGAKPAVMPPKPKKPKKPRKAPA